MAIDHYGLLEGRFSKYVGRGCALKTCYAIIKTRSFGSFYGSETSISLVLDDTGFSVLNTRGEIVNKGSMHNERNELAKLANAYPGALVVMEAGMHSPWSAT